MNSELIYLFQKQFVSFFFRNQLTKIIVIDVIDNSTNGTVKHISACGKSLSFPTAYYKSKNEEMKCVRQHLRHDLHKAKIY